MEVLAQSMIPPSWGDLLQTGGLGAIAFVLLWHTIQAHKEVTRTLKATSVSMIAFQQMLMILTLGKFRVSANKLSPEEESREYLQVCAVVEQVNLVLQQQRESLERALEK